MQKKDKVKIKRGPQYNDAHDVPLVKRKNNKDNIAKQEGNANGIKTKALGPALLKKNLLLALEQSLGVVTTACRLCGCSRETHYKMMQSDPDYRAAVEDLKEVTLDFAETQLHKQIIKGEVVSTIFFLKTQGKKRGYIEKTEVDHSIQRKPLDLSKLSDEELMQFQGLLAKLEA